MDVVSDRSRLIEYLYRVAVEPERYDDLMAVWDSVMTSATSEDEQDFADTELEGHVSQALRILQKMDALPAMATPLARSIELDPNPALLLSCNGHILTANEPAKQQLGAVTGKSIWQIVCDRSALDAALAGLRSKPDQQIMLAGLVQVKQRNETGTNMMALSCASCDHDQQVAGLLTTLAPIWGRQVIDALRDHFDLSPAESDIVYGLARGLDIKQIAETRGKSVNTVRTQMKTVLRKTGLDSQVRLVRLVGLLDRFNKPEEPDDGHPLPGGVVRKSFLTSAGSQLEYTITGPENGKPVLFIHGMLDGCTLTQDGLTALNDRNIKLITPSRPWFGGSFPVEERDNRPWQFAGMVEELMDELQIDRVPVFGHMAGAIYAASIAARLDKRISAVFNVGGGVPIISPQQFSMMTPRQRLIAQTAVKAPRLLPMFLKAGIALLRSGGADAFMKALYREAPVDFAVASRPEVKACLYEGYLFSVTQGHTAFQLDALEVTRNWSDIAQQIKCPVILIHGQHDLVVRIETVRDFAASLTNCRLVESEISGQLILANEPELVFSELDALLQNKLS